MKQELPLRLSFRTSVFWTSVLLLLAGSFGYIYAIEPGPFWSLLIYVLCLGASAFIMTMANQGLRPGEGETRHPQVSDGRSTVSMSENIGLSRPSTRSVQVEPVSANKPAIMVQRSLDLDGLAALRSLDHITTQWLVTDASDEAATLIRLACVALVDGGDAEMERAERWFDIAAELRSRQCRSLPKAELRRSFVADKVGVSKEQVRQIDQGRYAPLNRLLGEVDPKSL